MPAVFESFNDSVAPATNAATVFGAASGAMLGAAVAPATNAATVFGATFEATFGAAFGAAFGGFFFSQLTMDISNKW